MIKPINKVNDKSYIDITNLALNNLIFTTSTALSNSNQNAAIAQQQGQLLMQATTTQGLNAINNIASASISKAVDSILDK